MLGDYVRILVRALQVTVSAPVLWLAVLLLSLPSPPGQAMAWLPSCALDLLVLPAGFLGMVAVPYAVFQAEKGRRASLSDTWQAAKKALLRYMGLVAIVAVPGLCLLLVGELVFSKPVPTHVVVIATMLAKYAVLPIAGEAIAFALAGIVLRGLDPIRALAEAVSLLSHNFGLALLTGVSLSVLMLIPQGALLAMQGGADNAINALASFRAIAPTAEGGLEVTTWYLIQYLIYLPFLVYQWSVLVVMYVCTSERIAPLRLSGEVAA